MMSDINSRHNKKILVVAAVFLLVILAVFIFFLLVFNKKFEKTKRNSRYEQEKAIGREIFQRAPCKEPLVNDNGICKYPEGAPCLYSTECVSSCFCFEGVCTKKPEKNESMTLMNDFVVCVDRNIMVLQGDHFVLFPNLWSIQSCVCICEGNKRDIFVLTENGIYYLENIHGKPAWISDSEDIMKIFFYSDSVYALKKDQKIWRNLKEKVEFIRGRDISQEIILNVFCDGENFVLYTPKKRLFYNGKRWTETYTDTIPKTLEIRGELEIAVFDHAVSITGKNGETILEIKNIECCVSDPRNIHVLYIIEKEEKQVKRIHWKLGEIQEEMLHISGIDLLRTRSYVILVTEVKCNII